MEVRGDVCLWPFLGALLSGLGAAGLRPRILASQHAVFIWESACFVGLLEGRYFDRLPEVLYSSLKEHSGS